MMVMLVIGPSPRYPKRLMEALTCRHELKQSLSSASVINPEPTIHEYGFRNYTVIIGEGKWGKYDSNDLKKFVEKTNFIKSEKIFITKIKNETKIDNI